MPLALFAVLAVVSAIYVAIYLVLVGTYPDLAGDQNPVVQASTLFLGPVGATIVAVGIVLSVLGTNAAQALVGRRRLYAMPEQGDLPSPLARVTSKGVPAYAIGVTLLLAIPLTISGTFKVPAVLAVLARFLHYIPTCLAVLVLRRRDEPPGYRIPSGPAVPLLALIVCMWLLLDAGTESAAIGGLELPTLVWGGLAALVGVPFYFLTRRTAATPAT